MHPTFGTNVSDIKAHLQQVIRLILGAEDVPHANYRYDSGWVAITHAGIGSFEDFPHHMVTIQGEKIIPSRIEVWWTPTVAPDPVGAPVNITGWNYLGLRTLSVPMTHNHTVYAHSHTTPTHTHVGSEHSHTIDHYHGYDHSHEYPFPTPTNNTMFVTGSAQTGIPVPGSTPPLTLDAVKGTTGTGTLTTTNPSTDATTSAGSAAATPTSQRNGIIVQAGDTNVRLRYGDNVGPTSDFTSWTNTGRVRIVAHV